MATETKRALAIPPTMQTRARDATLLQAAQGVHPEVRKFIARKAVHSQVVKKQTTYYSVVRFPFDIQPVPVPAGTQPTQWTYTLNRKKVIAFSYGLSEDMGVAGFPQGYTATEADTNLITRGDTGGAVVQIHGLSLHLDETSDAMLAQYLWSRTYVDISLDGSTRYVLLGRMGRITSPGGLYGTGQSFLAQPPIGASTTPVSVMTNGMPHAHNFYKLAERIRWNPSSQIDSKFQVRFEVTRPIQFTSTIRPAAPGVAPYTPPTNPGDPGTYVDVVVYLHAQDVKPRTLQP